MLKLYNTLSRQKEDFIPLHPDKIGMYVCGPTVYDSPHLGNALSVVVYDCLFRLLKYLYADFKVTYVRNITDVDDKINIAAKQKGISINELTSKITDEFHHDIKLLNCLPPTIEPKATEHIKEMITIIEQLLKNGNAYVGEDHVFFAVNSDPNYAMISGRKIDEMIQGARVAVSDIKKSAEDFVLWKPASEEDDESSIFDSPWGRGRPGWHIECSAMASKYLGNDFDIHGGGIDLLFPHHTNEIAQSCCANKGSKFARFWVHNGFLTVDGEKMSKSLGNFITLRELLAKGIPGEVIRYVFMSSHYRKPSDWNEKDIIDAKNTLDNYYSLLQESDITDINGASVPEEFLACLKDDLNTPMAYAFMHELAKKARNSGNKKLGSQYALELKTCANLLGFLENTWDGWFHGGISLKEKAEIEALINQRLEAKAKKEYSRADEIRTQLKNKGIVIEDKNDSTTIWKKIGVIL